jgi:2-polyprenyl-3-methyl-5-hydroxy-6-metoxy-1,4-benzoquinol methylase/glycosyltransferase involved in cell wall biosynthesis
MKTPHDVVIIQRHPMAFTHPFNSKLNLWWLHDLALLRQSGFVQRHLVNIDRIFTVSEFHRQQVAETYKINPGYIVPTVNGVDYKAFEGLEGYEREPRTLVYMARPERGLENLVGRDDCIMNELKDCHLYVCGYDNTTPQMKSYYEWLWSRCEELPNVTNLGSLGKRELYQLLAKCMVYAYPTTFEDTSCIAALEANAAGLPVVGYKWSAVPETLTGGGAILLPMKEKDGNPYVDKKQYADTVRSLLGNTEQWQTLHKKALTKKQTWAQAALQWDELFHDLLAVKSHGAFRLAKHCERMSDIVAADETGIIDLIPDVETNYAFYLNNDYQGHYDRYYEYEKNRGVNYGPETLDRNPRFECISDIIGKLAPKTVLDYGCAHGPYTVNLWKRYPALQMTGVDINARNIAIAEKWAADEGMDATFINGMHEDVTGTYDLILASEVLEHVPDPQVVIGRLMQHVNPGGHILISTPYGAWEAIGYKDHLGWRSHLHHFERSDLLEMFGNQKNYRCISVPTNPEFGHFIVTFQPSGKPCGQIDYARKMREQAPQQTVSACLIAKDSEYTLGKVLQSLKGIADEIIVGIDSDTTDNTKEIAERFGAITFKIDSPIRQGFDAARNETIARSTMDWILWIDSDETLENPHNLLKYLRDNQFNGYAIKQHHYAVEPPALYKTDYPVRIFRNHKGIKFFGVVHEHPEIKMNQGVGQVIVLDDVAIMHTGYSTEEIRRKRFSRNYPLMKRDREKYPERKLGKFLWMRDCAHFVRFSLERNGGRITSEMLNCCDEAVKMWRDLLKQGETRMVVEGLQFYSEAVQVMTQDRGIRFALNLNAAKGNGGISLDGKPIDGLFLEQGDIDALVKHLVEMKTKPFESRYF